MKRHKDDGIPAQPKQMPRTLPPKPKVPAKAAPDCIKREPQLLVKIESSFMSRILCTQGRKSRGPRNSVPRRSCSRLAHILGNTSTWYWCPTPSSNSASKSSHLSPPLLHRIINKPLWMSSFEHQAGAGEAAGVGGAHGGGRLLQRQVPARMRRFLRNQR